MAICYVICHVLFCKLTIVRMVRLKKGTGTLPTSRTDARGEPKSLGQPEEECVPLPQPAMYRGGQRNTVRHEDCPGERGPCKGIPGGFGGKPPNDQRNNVDHFLSLQWGASPQTPRVSAFRHGRRVSFDRPVREAQFVPNSIDRRSPDVSATRDAGSLRRVP